MPENRAGRRSDERRSPRVVRVYVPARRRADAQFVGTQLEDKLRQDGVNQESWRATQRNAHAIAVGAGAVGAGRRLRVFNSASRRRWKVYVTNLQVGCPEIHRVDT